MDNRPRVPLYRIENPAAPNDYANSEDPYDFNRGLISHPDILGQWFFREASDTFGYVQKAIYRYPEHSDSAQFIVGYPLADEVEALRAEYHPIASRMRFNRGDYIVPRDGSIPVEVFSIKSLVKKTTSLNGYTVPALPHRAMLKTAKRVERRAKRGKYST